MAEPDIPTHLDLGGHRFTVDSSPETGLLLHDEESLGDSRPDRLLIRIDPQRPHTAVAETLLHEAMHCAWKLSALRNGPPSEHEELVVTGLAPLLLELLRRNPPLVAYLTAQ